MAVEVKVRKESITQVKRELDSLALQPGHEIEQDHEGNVTYAYGMTRGKPSTFAGTAATMSGVISAMTK